MNRRPLKTRERAWAKAIARLLIRLHISPNAISIVSIVFAAGAAAAFFTANFIAAAICIQLRLLCNMLDGMVAIEGGLKSKTGDVFNDLPDRIADPLIIVPAGYAITSFVWGPALGWSAGLLAVFTAYVRLLGGSLGLAQDFRGPMAKPHRMATLTAGSIVEMFWPYGLVTALAVIVAGTIVTIVRRLHRMLRELKTR